MNLYEYQDKTRKQFAKARLWNNLWIVGMNIFWAVILILAINNRG